MSRWEPHVDLMHLLEALANEIVSATEQEVRQACAEEGWSMAMTAKLRCKEVRELIDAVNGDEDDPRDLKVDAGQGDIELRTSRHLQSVAERGSRACYKQH
jgi:thymidine phosphorylase